MYTDDRHSFVQLTDEYAGMTHVAIVHAYQLPANPRLKAIAEIFIPAPTGTIPDALLPTGPLSLAERPYSSTWGIDNRQGSRYFLKAFFGNARDTLLEEAEAWATGELERLSDALS